MKTKILSIFLLLLIPFSIIFSFEFSNGFVLGKYILTSLRMPVYSNINTGWYFPGIIGVTLLSIGWIGSRKLLKDRYPRLVDNIFGFVLGFIFLLKSIGWFKRWNVEVREMGLELDILSCMIFRPDFTVFIFYRDKNDIWDKNKNIKR